MLSWLVWFLPAIVILEIWDAFWKLAGLWYSARTSKWWFLGIAIVNSLGILPIYYLWRKRLFVFKKN
ncbi:MAG TPA: DUF5652 family protein [Candidatus Acidoferrum sp.]|nr:DUF5652 family protein [Candidatus Acidoferrum sp.]